MGFTFIMFMMSMPKFGIFVVAATFVVFLIAAGYFYHFLSEVVRAAAAGDDKLPETSSGEEVFQDAFNWWACTLLCTAPAWVFQLVNWWNELGWPAEIGQVLLILSLLYTPMALLATSLFNTFLAANPVYVIGAIFKCPLQYFTACFMMVTVLFIYTLLDQVITERLLEISFFFSLSLSSISSPVTYFCMCRSWSCTNWEPSIIAIANGSDGSAIISVDEIQNTPSLSSRCACGIS